MPVGLSETLFSTDMHERSFWVPGSVDFDVSRVQDPFQAPFQDPSKTPSCIISVVFWSQPCPKSSNEPKVEEEDPHNSNSILSHIVEFLGYFAPRSPADNSPKSLKVLVPQGVPAQVVEISTHQNTRPMSLVPTSECRDWPLCYMDISRIGQMAIALSFSRFYFVCCAQNVSCSDCSLEKGMTQMPS